MKGLSPKQLSQKGVSYLEEAVLDVLFKAYNQESLSAREISRRAGLPRREHEKWEDDMIAYGVLDKLQNEGRVKNDRLGKGAGRWQLTEKEFEKRRDD
jgi:DNA-binding IclR family transcriptional regulator